ncbi:hypothetical protein SAMD00019534_082170 [Acytostelium subglobosum LB1]|uniref:hypothetical protein n=1 Tax=Acytostelium subglobosum LB1 TaxID=1410327 RepID=UPI000644CA40|nr:hypothetical protein SAMD00019534_082170 [Acytostelium subglobosum LB1]GAM25042.1 hypothetical protein SAMD00019534_082170 [Acytostelium subglobosum LB1]|eukprot:XP_012752131.1 hypothetical protein SAMD00019534_082170 [Acytostelium subglobosum LB1]
MSSGGLVAALSGLESNSFIWVGWIGTDIDECDKQAVTDMLLEQHNCIPIFLDPKLSDDYYNGFSNAVLWPLFHYLPLDLEYDDNLWLAYQAANQEFANVLLPIVKPNDLIWVHDYHLMLLPELIKREQPEARVGFFLHIPFPTSEIFRVLPCNKDILKGVLHADLIGFHTYDYGRYFLKSCTRLVGVETAPNGVYFKERFVPVGVFPVGIDPDKFIISLQCEKVNERIEELKKNFKGKKIIIGIDRLDYIKGLPNKLQAMECLFQKYPQWKDKLVLIQVAVPSRQDVEEYQKLKQNVEELVGRINGLYGSLGHQPIHYLFKSVDMKELTALYNIADAALITSIRDGMNLVAHEYVTCQTGDKGVLILSEFTGAAQSLPGAMIINPWNSEDVADAIHNSLMMSPDEKEVKHSMLFNFILGHTASHWGNGFVRELIRAGGHADKLSATPRLNIESVIESYRSSTNRLLVLAYDGALVPLSTFPANAAPSKDLLQVLGELSKDPANHVLLLSSRDKKTLGQWFDGLPNVGLSAEYGSFIRSAGATEWEQTGPSLDASWKDKVRRIINYYVLRTPGSYIEENETLLTWHYGNADPVYGQIQARELHLNLDNLPFEVIVRRDKSIGVRPLHSTSSSALIRSVIQQKQQQQQQQQQQQREDDLQIVVGDDERAQVQALECGLDFLLVVGDPNSLNKEVMQIVSKEGANTVPSVYTVSVGKRTTKDQFYLIDDYEVRLLLEQLSNARREEHPE